MALPLTRIENWVPGEEVDSTDLQDLASWARMKDAILGFAVTGATAWLPAFNQGGIACVPGSGLQVLLQTVGGADSCRILLPQRSADGGWTSTNPTDAALAQAAYYTPPTGGYPQALATPSGTSKPYRTDLIAVQFTAVNVSPHSVNVRAGSVVAPQTVYAIDDTLAFTYVPGTPSATFPAPTPNAPAGYAALYTVYVQHGDTSVGPPAILLVMPTFDQVIAAMSNTILTTAPFPCPAAGAQFTIATNNAPSIDGAYYFLIGPYDNHSLVAVQNSGQGTNALTMTCIRVLFGVVGNTIARRALVQPLVQPVLYEQDGSRVTTTVVESCGFVNDPGAGPSSAPVVFTRAFALATDYRILGLTPIGAAFSPFVTNKTASGFTINIPAGGGHGNVDWAVRGSFTP